MADKKMTVAAAKYISFTSFRPDGSAASTPVWVVPFRGGYAFTSDDTSFKVKRISRNPRARIAPSTFRGLVAEGAEVLEGTTELFRGDDFIAVEKLIKRKYWLGWYLAIVPSQFFARFKKESAPGSVAILVTPDRGE
jgi:PPOX class probable F420-dependent enzyme